MKSIIVDIDQNDIDELGISSSHISMNELKKQILIHSIRKQRELLETVNKKHGFDKLTEEEIFNSVSEVESIYKNKKEEVK